MPNVDWTPVPFDNFAAMSRELILGMAVPIDGFVSGPNGEID